MSSTNRGGQRCDADFYPTAAWMVDRLLEACQLPGGRWLEPGAGDGAIIRAVNARRTDVRWTAVELREHCRAPLMELLGPGPRIHIGDFLTWMPGVNTSGPLSTVGELARFDVCIGNPPYSLAQEFVDRCLALAAVVLFPLRLNFLGSEARREWFGRIGVPDVFVLPNRPDFSGNGGDSCEYAWMRFTRPEFKVRRTLAATGEVVWDPGSIRILATTPRAVRVAQKPRGPTP